MADLPDHSAVAWHGASSERLCKIDDFRCGDAVVIRLYCLTILHALAYVEEAFGSCRPLDWQLVVGQVHPRSSVTAYGLF